ncbi:LapA family protein [Marinomonas mediterranea]|jgi:Protein of unknown function (DUF1049).|uniref:Lipopolysaccharide assembly protein A domain-containing protein n=1 Tax=Marinomonas mediterranea (strain ATCC 700492 / JCM 21426 / NBRC 103028 / MMB-1) TaxID=717774 RepID=F2JZ16_MARM1|nr:LapA family protein [Marinomonas mediterranea]ADZ91994.1 protein of unknown function DUF1049 [Marinomonas mediterranea MMB-1]WCN09938.1 DUF1049 domain-containing protein [Marinomonas mediterranea]WCN14020.1 DUF1049 domain-containing protein [Marinomonas mediterranea]WCN18071.1 DUF1049 domain-containing protein [Marinomonas mediterranea MMB-1]
MLKWLKRVLLAALLIVFLVVGVFFSIRNPQLITLDLVVWHGPELSIALYLILAFAAGAIVALLASSVTLLRSDRQIKLLSKKLDKNRSELDSLRKASLTKELAVSEE